MVLAILFLCSSTVVGCSSLGLVRVLALLLGLSLPTSVSLLHGPTATTATNLLLGVAVTTIDYRATEGVAIGFTLVAEVEGSTVALSSSSRGGLGALSRIAGPITGSSGLGRSSVCSAVAR